MKTITKFLNKSKSRSSSLFRLVSPSPSNRIKINKRCFSQSSFTKNASNSVFAYSKPISRNKRLREVNRQNFFGNFGGSGGGHTNPNVENTKLYTVLGVDKKADATSIKRAYRKKVKENHPDRGGDTEKFKEINAAYEILGDEKKRQMYDQHGLEGMQNQMGDMGGMEDIFETLFRGAGGGHQSARRQKPKMKTVILEIKVNLKDLYDGAAKNISYNRDENCQPCGGEGGKNVKICVNCKGMGVVTKMVSMGPGMYSQSQSPCGQCRGQGKTIKHEDICKTCNGQKNTKKVAKIEVQIPKGAPKGYFIKFPGKGDQHPDARDGDLVVKLIPDVHPVYKKKKSDLYMKQRVSLIEALSGFKFNVERLDGSKVTIKTEPGEIIKNRQMKKVSLLGLPHFERNYSYGDLYIEFLVDYPQKISEENMEKLKEILPEPLIKDFKETSKSYQMKPVTQWEMEIIDEEDKKQSYQEEEERGQQVDCNSQ